MNKQVTRRSGLRSAASSGSAAYPTNADVSSRAVTSSSNDDKAKTPFPVRLYEMLDAAERDGFAEIVSWLPDGQSFKIHNLKRFGSEIMVRFFSQTKRKSFQRQVRQEKQASGEQKSVTHFYETAS